MQVVPSSDKGSSLVLNSDHIFVTGYFTICITEGTNCNQVVVDVWDLVCSSGRCWNVG